MRTTVEDEYEYEDEGERNRIDYEYDYEHEHKKSGFRKGMVNMRVGLGLTVALAAMIALTCPVMAATLDSLVQDLAGNDEAARATARQMLPYQSIEAVPKLMPLLVNERTAVSWAAYNVLCDFANQVSAPGREKDRERVAAELMTLVAEEQPRAVKVWGLELLSVVTPDEFDVKPVAALLKDAELRERARASLELMGTRPARQALRKALRGAEPDFQYALLNTLGRLQDEASLRAAVKLARSGDPRVRAAASRALAWTGDSTYLKQANAVRAAADDATRAEATDALLRLADAMAKMRDTPPALAAYADVLKTATELSLRGAALSGLVRYGDETVAETVLTGIGSDSGVELRPVALSAMEYAQGAPSSRLLLALYPKLPPDMRARALGAMGRKGDPMFFDTLKAATADGDLAMRLAAIGALADSNLPEAVGVLGPIAQGDAADERFAARAGLKHLAEQFRLRGNKAAAGEAYLALYHGADSEPTRRAAVEGMARNPTPAVFDALLGAVEKGDAPMLPAAELGLLARSLQAEGRTDEAKRALGMLTARANTTEAVQEVIQSARGAGVPDLAHRLGFVQAWKLAGPFPWLASEGFTKAHVGEPDVDLSASYEANGAKIAWKDYATKDEAGIVDLGGVMGAQANATAYGVAVVKVPADTDAVVRAGSDDGIKIWVNGAAVIEKNVDRGTALDQDQAPVKLKAGENRILVQVTQGGGGWNYCLRLTKPDGTPLDFGF